MGDRLTKQQTTERRVKALELRATGADYATVVRECGYSSEAVARKDVSRALEGTRLEAGRNLLTLERVRTDAAHQLAWKLATDPALSARDRVLAIREVTRVLGHRLRLLGLDKAAADLQTAESLGEVKVYMTSFRQEIEAQYAQLPGPPGDPTD